jgi:hypothetical protein
VKRYQSQSKHIPILRRVVLSEAMLDPSFIFTQYGGLSEKIT